MSSRPQQFPVFVHMLSKAVSVIISCNSICTSGMILTFISPVSSSVGRRPLQVWIAIMQAIFCLPRLGRARLASTWSSPGTSMFRTLLPGRGAWLDDKACRLQQREHGECMARAKQRGSLVAHSKAALEQIDMPYDSLVWARRSKQHSLEWGSGVSFARSRTRNITVRICRTLTYPTQAVISTNCAGARKTS